MKKEIMDGDLSLLWPEPEGAQWGENTKNFLPPGNDCPIQDLGLEELAAALSYDRRHLLSVRSLLNKISDDPLVLSYRLDILDDLLKAPQLNAGLKELLPIISELKDSSSSEAKDIPPFLKTIHRLGELTLCVKIVNQLNTLFQEPAIKSSGLKRWRDFVKAVSEDEVFQTLTVKLPQMRAGLEKIASVTIGINLNAQLKPVEAVLLSINEQRYTEKPFLQNLFGGKNKSEYQGIGEFHTMKGIPSQPDTYDQAFDNQEKIGLTIALFEDLHQILEKIVKPIAAEVHQYTKVHRQPFIKLESELGFYLGALELIETLRDSGLSMCRPEIASKEARIFQVSDLRNINLALHFHYQESRGNLDERIVANDVCFDETGRIFILTGPNRGGKTTYTQAVGLAQILCQLGLYVPGVKARISPVDRIFTHFPLQERPDSDLGRLGEESKRLNEIFQNATRHSLVLLNESLASTSPGESLYLSREVLSGLKLLGARAIFATHLHDLAVNLERFNQELPGDCPVVSMVSQAITEDGKQPPGTEEGRRTYKIIPGPPQGYSFAKDIAVRHRISLEQLVQTLKERDILAADYHLSPKI